ncbi:MAG: acyltransferase 3 family protein [Tardiphaga sp.]|nr:acyltransferase 3 family protein [Tardiphaga sp.]
MPHRQPVINGAQSRVRSLQIGRGLAALCVVLFHLNNSVWGVAKYFPHPFSPLLSFGNAGVQFFFVLSGFIIFLIHGKDLGSPSRLWSFANKRLIRVYPVYWIVLGAFVVTLYLEPFLGTADERRIGNFIASVLLIPAPVEPILSVAWTLTHEVMFYVVFGLAIAHARSGVWLFAIWQIACLGNTMFGTSDFPYGVMFSANNLLFSFGMLAAFVFRTQRCPAPALLAAGGAAAFIATGLHQVTASRPMPPEAYVLAYGLASAVAILGACVYEQRHGLRVPRLCDAIGDASYSIYLIHLPLLSVFAKLLFASGLAAMAPEWLSLTGLLCMVVVTGVVFSRLVEMPLIALLGRLGQSRCRIDRGVVPEVRR